MDDEQMESLDRRAFLFGMTVAAAGLLVPRLPRVVVSSDVGQDWMVMDASDTLQVTMGQVESNGPCAYVKRALRRMERDAVLWQTGSFYSSSGLEVLQYRTDRHLMLLSQGNKPITGYRVLYPEVG